MRIIRAEPILLKGINFSFVSMARIASKIRLPGEKENGFWDSGVVR
jgi:hypothetical protein